MGKCSPIEEYRVQKRGGKGIITVNRTEKTGDVVALKEVLPDDELMLITKQGIAIRMPVKGIRVAAATRRASSWSIWTRTTSSWTSRAWSRTTTRNPARTPKLPAVVGDRTRSKPAQEPADEEAKSAWNDLFRAL